MRGSHHYESRVVTVQGDATAAEIAELMDLHAVGSVVVTDDAGGPVGIVTDRDLLRRVVAVGRDGESARADDVMSSELVTGSSEDALEDLLKRMVARGVRRVPLLKEGRLSGIVSLDDVVCEIARELGDVREALRGEVIGARRHARRRHRREEIESALEEMRGQLMRLGTQSVEWLHKELDGLRTRLGG